jgi:hypothetical protein
MKPIIIAFEGGPLALKTTTTRNVTQEFGSQVLTMPEVASILLNNGFPKPGRDIEFSEQWLHWFENSVVSVQENMEDAYRAMALNQACRVLCCDRGLKTPAAYLSYYTGNDLNYFLDKFGYSDSALNERYDLIIHFETLAATDPKKYLELMATNPGRYETPEQAVKIDDAIKAVWNSHENRIIIPSNLGVKEITQRVLNIIGKYLHVEMERKFLFQELPLIDLGTPKQVRQGYLDTDVEFRLRQLGDEYFVTIKDDGTSIRPECERSIDGWAFERLWPETSGRQWKNFATISLTGT